MYRLNLPFSQEGQRIRICNQMMEEEEVCHPHPLHPWIMNKTNVLRRRQRTRLVYVLQGPAGPPGRDGRDGANAPIQPILQPQLNTTQMNTTPLEQSFDRMGQSMVEVLSEQKVANLHLRDQMEQKSCNYAGTGKCYEGPSGTFSKKSI